MNSQHYNAGRLMALFLYVLQGIFTAIHLFVTMGAYPILTWGVFLFFIISFILLLSLSEDNGVPVYGFCICVASCSTGMGVVLTWINKNMMYLILLYMVQCLVVSVFRQKRSSVMVGAVTLFTLNQFAVFKLLGIVDVMTWRDFWLCQFGVLISIWVMLNHMSLQYQNEKKSRDQEQSLNDMLHIVGVMCDEAKESAKSKTNFLSNMSHEIRTPINSILGMNEMIIREAKDEQTLEYAKTIASSGNMLLSLINDILDFSKIESGKMEVLPVSYRLSVMVHELVNMISGRVNEKGLAFDVEVDPFAPEYLLGDEVKLRQIVTNLLTNAVKYTDTGDVKLRVYTEKRDRLFLCFEVTDTGQGIREEDQQHLFDAFQRVDQKRNRNIEGTGLGLAIVNNFVKMMDGEIGFESEYGVGSTFYVKIPQEDEKHIPVGDFHEKVQKEEKNKENYQPLFEAPSAHILLVDDNKMNLTVAKLLLKATKVVTISANSGQEAIDKMMNHNFELVLLDHMMPEMDGIETLQKMKRMGLIKNVPVIALTANAVSGAREMYLEAGFSDYLTKPIKGEELERCLLKWLPEDKITRLDAKIVTMLVQEDAVEAKDEGQELINRKVAAEYSAGSQGMYTVMVEAYLEEVETKIKTLRESLTQGDYETYRITVHSLKSTSLQVGAVGLSEFAKKLEFAAKGGNYEQIQQENEALLALYQDVSAALKENATL
ncbi:Signal transduction histidine kinase [Lachnospiraceae bacterium C10]|nr:Signal transduction histidine kinase [Lachnospiraceae bacterium C10]